jgi:hypothetical protein
LMSLGQGRPDPAAGASAGLDLRIRVEGMKFTLFRKIGDMFAPVGIGEDTNRELICCGYSQ